MICPDLIVAHEGNDNLNVNGEENGYLQVIYGDEIIAKEVDINLKIMGRKSDC